MTITRKLALALSGALVLAFATAAQAGVARDYSGTVEKDSNTFIAFNLDKGNGKTKVSKVIAALPYVCAGPTTDGGTALATAKGSLTVKSNKTFAGKLKFGNVQTRSALRGTGPTGGDYKITGKLGKHGKVTGTIAGELFFNQTMTRGSETERCYTGGLDWKASKTG